MNLSEYLLAIERFGLTSGLISGLMSCWLGDPVEDEGEAKGAEMQ